MSDEHDRPGAASDGDETGEVEAAGGHGPQTALETRPVTGPLRPTGKRARQRTAAGGSAAADGDAVTTAIEISESSVDAETEKIKVPGKGLRIKKAKKKGEAPFRDALVFPFAYVYNYLKEITTELRKVIWPNRKQMITYTSVMFVFLVFMIALISGADYGFARLVLLVFGE